MSDRQRLDLEEGRCLRKAGFDTVGRYLFNRPLECGENAIGPDVLEAAAELMRGTDAEYAPVAVELARYGNGTEPKSNEKTVALVNKEEPDDVIVLCPRLVEGGGSR